MNINYNLTNPSAGKNSVRVVITHRGKVYRKSIGVTVPAGGWSVAKQKPVSPTLRKLLNELTTAIEEAIGEDSTEDEIKAVLERIDRGKLEAVKEEEVEEKPSFFEFFYDWALREKGAGRQNLLMYNNVKKMMPRTTWESIDSAYYVKLIRKMTERGMRPNYQGVSIGRIKTMLNEAYALHYIDNCDFREWKKPKEETFAVVLTQDEVDAMWNAELTNERLAKVRDLAMLGILTASRYSDYSRLSEDNIVGDRIVYTQKKTQTPVQIPCSPKIRTVLERNGGRAPKMVDQVYNRGLKDLCRELGFDKVVDIPRSLREKMGREEGEPVYKWELVSSHTMRRTGATLLYKSGVPARVVRYLTGHSKDEVLMRYIKIDRDEAADILAESEMFK